MVAAPAPACSFLPQILVASQKNLRLFSQSVISVTLRVGRLYLPMSACHCTFSPVVSPSWVGAMMALANTASDKQAFCKKFGHSIEPEEWPCHHLCDLHAAALEEFRVDIQRCATWKLLASTRTAASYWEVSSLRQALLWTSIIEACHT